MPQTDQSPDHQHVLCRTVPIPLSWQQCALRSRHPTIFSLLNRSISVQAAGAPCEVYTDGMTVEVEDSDYEPDAVVHCGSKLPDDAVTVPDPMIIVEVLSPSTSATDRAWKLREYFKLPSLRHYLIVWADKQQIAHHRRGDDGAIETHAISGGEMRLDPPGITIRVEGIYAP